MPDKIDGLANVLGNHVVCVVITIGTRENDNSEFHASISTRKSSITGFERTSRAIRVAVSRAWSSLTPLSIAISKYLPCRTSEILGKPSNSTECWIAFPCGSRIPGLRVTYTLAFIIVAPRKFYGKRLHFE